MASFMDFPRDIQKLIMTDYCDPHDAIRLGKTCKTLYSILTIMEKRFLEANITIKRMKNYKEHLQKIGKNYSICTDCNTPIKNKNITQHKYRCVKDAKHKSIDYTQCPYCSECNILHNKLKYHILHRCRWLKDFRIISCSCCKRKCLWALMEKIPFSMKDNIRYLCPTCKPHKHKFMFRAKKVPPLSASKLALSLFIGAIVAVIMINIGKPF